MSDFKFVRVNCDYCAEGVWSEDGGSMSIDSLPISRKLKSSILKWQCEFETVPYWLEERYIESDWYKLRQLNIARRLKYELPDYVVVAGMRLINDDLTVGEDVPYGGDNFQDWKDGYLLRETVGTG
ncbi:hypothetical protein [Qipengyuania vesicularis]|uniref:hypothetical protein n=1 Tax=Qipengyuania vesicularis TaxID=2867232 RepID=UPI001C871D00|nr:hypothetical protein [Qipengyuania vesicularis]MBX7528556.1 hypothetical protein [Qipengyuania vesicularis]